MWKRSPSKVDRDNVNKTEFYFPRDEFEQDLKKLREILIMGNEKNEPEKEQEPKESDIQLNQKEITQEKSKLNESTNLCEGLSTTDSKEAQTEPKTHEPLKTTSKTPLKIRENLQYLLGIKQQLPEKVNCPRTKEQQKLEDVTQRSTFPCSRLALDSPLQCAAFITQLESLQINKDEYFFYYKWVLWKETTETLESGKKLSLRPIQIIETNLDLKLAAKYYKRNLDQDKLIFFKLGFIPNREEGMKDGAIIGFQTPLAISGDMLKQTLVIVMGDGFYLPKSIYRKSTLIYTERSFN